MAISPDAYLATVAGHFAEADTLISQLPPGTSRLPGLKTFLAGLMVNTPGVINFHQIMSQVPASPAASPSAVAVLQCLAKWKTQYAMPVTEICQRVDQQMVQFPDLLLIIRRLTQIALLNPAQLIETLRIGTAFIPRTKKLQNQATQTDGQKPALTSVKKEMASIPPVEKPILEQQETQTDAPRSTLVPFEVQTDPTSSVAKPILEQQETQTDAPRWTSGETQTDTNDDVLSEKEDDGFETANEEEELNALPSEDETTSDSGQETGSGSEDEALEAEPVISITPNTPPKKSAANKDEAGFFNRLGERASHVPHAVMGYAERLADPAKTATIWLAQQMIAPLQRAPKRTRTALYREANGNAIKQAVMTGTPPIQFTRAAQKPKSKIKKNAPSRDVFQIQLPGYMLSWIHASTWGTAWGLGGALAGLLVLTLAQHIAHDPLLSMQLLPAIFGAIAFAVPFIIYLGVYEQVRVHQALLRKEAQEAGSDKPVPSITELLDALLAANEKVRQNLDEHTQNLLVGDPSAKQSEVALRARGLTTGLAVGIAAATAAVGDTMLETLYPQTSASVRVARGVLFFSHAMAAYYPLLLPGIQKSKETKLQKQLDALQHQYVQRVRAHKAQQTAATVAQPPLHTNANSNAEAGRASQKGAPHKWSPK